MARKIALALLIFVVVYLGVGLAFHFKWERALATCRETREARGEFVEPEVFSGVLGLFFDVTGWPAYVLANVYHDGTPFATPCTHSKDIGALGKKGFVRYEAAFLGRCLQNVSF